MFYFLSKYKYRLIAILFWLIVWQIVSKFIQKEYLLASPKSVISALFYMVRIKGFWQAILSSFGKIALGFFSAVLCGVLLSLFSYINSVIKEIIMLIIRLIKSIPVASFVIVALLWVESKNLSILISFLMVLPIIYINVLKGIESTERKLLEMAQVFRISFVIKVRYIYIPAVMPYFITACSLSLGMCWKSGIAAELIGQPINSIGEKLYQAKLYLMTKELFAWTIVIVLLSILFEKLVMLMIQKVAKCL